MEKCCVMCCLIDVKREDWKAPTPNHARVQHFGMFRVGWALSVRCMDDEMTFEIFFYLLYRTEVGDEGQSTILGRSGLNNQMVQHRSLHAALVAASLKPSLGHDACLYGTFRKRTLSVRASNRRPVKCRGAQVHGPPETASILAVHSLVASGWEGF